MHAEATIHSIRHRLGAALGGLSVVAFALTWVGILACLAGPLVAVDPSDAYADVIPLIAALFAIQVSFGYAIGLMLGGAACWASGRFTGAARLGVGCNGVAALVLSPIWTVFLTTMPR